MKVVIPKDIREYVETVNKPYREPSKFAGDNIPELLENAYRTVLHKEETVLLSHVNGINIVFEPVPKDNLGTDK